DIARKEMGLDWMLHPKSSMENISIQSSSQHERKETSPETIKKDNPREVNPYLKDNGSGYPEEGDLMKNDNKSLLSSSVVGDGGASWRLKALKRAQEQAAREGKNFQNVVEERWGSIGDFAASVASQEVAPTYAHLHSIKKRRKGPIDDVVSEKDIGSKSIGSDLQRDQKMRLPKVDHSLSWRKSGRQNLSAKDSAVLSAAMSNLNKFSNDGSFMDNFVHKEDNSSSSSSKPSTSPARVDSYKFSSIGKADDAGHVKPALSANQLAAKAMQLRMRGKHEEAEKLMTEVESMKEKHDIKSDSRTPRVDAITSRCFVSHFFFSKRKKEDDADLHLAQKIVRNRGSSNLVDEEYDFDGSPRRKGRKKGGDRNQKPSQITNSARPFTSQQERCSFCFESPARPKHLVIAIGNFAYLSLPQHQPVVPGHCCILTLQHENSTRNLDDDVWEEIRNFKKCLIMMYSKQEKDVLFIETVVQVARQKRHCLVECIPLPQDVAKQAPLYFKKAIDEAEEEWSQHNAKKLIDTSEKGLRGSIPKNFPYFHVEFGLKKGFVHVIDDETEFETSFGLNVVRGMLQLPAEDMHRRRRQETFESQRRAVADFLRDWKPFDWTKQLE
ncbi:hypothetical protein M569_09269, partial [Genlisea aurea]